MDDWQPIATAPKGKGELLVLCWFVARDTERHVAHLAHYMPGGHSIEDHPPIDGGWYRWNGCQFVTCQPTHWMPYSAPSGEVKS